MFFAGYKRSPGKVLPALLCLFFCTLQFIQFASFWKKRVPHSRKFGAVDSSVSNFYVSSQDCISLDKGKDMDILLSKYKQVFVMMPAKASGTSLKTFTRRCMQSSNTSSFAEIDNIFSKSAGRQEAFVEQLKMPSLVASHATNLSHILNLIKHVTRDSLIVYSHREETDRLMSAIKQVVRSMCRVRGESREGLRITAGECYVNEKLLTDTIASRIGEIHMGAPELLTCETYKAIEDRRPTMIFMDYEKASQLQRLLAKHHCPEVTDTFRISSSKSLFTVLGGSENTGTVVSMDEWLSAKKGLMEYVYGLRRDASCQGVTQDIEDDLFSCRSATLDVSRRTFRSRQTTFSSW